MIIVATRRIGGASHEPKMKVVPSGMLLESSELAIKFANELAESPTWRASCWCLTAKSAQGYSKQ